MRKGALDVFYVLATFHSHLFFIISLQQSSQKKLSKACLRLKEARAQQLGGVVLNEEQIQKMSLKENLRAGQSGGRKAAVREELLPSQHPLTKPTRDISASNRSHSITRDDPPIFHSDRRLLLLQREAEENEFQKQANIVYTKQFRSLAKLMGNESMEFDQLREKIESLVLRDFPMHPDPVLSQRIQNLQRELAKRNMAVEVNRSSQSLPSSNQYLRGLENQLGRKSKMINQLSDSIKRQAFEEAIKNMQAEIEAKTQELKQIQEQSQEMRMKANSSISILEEELIRHKQTIQKLTFELDTQKRKAHNSLEDIERLKRREKELATSLENETKANYQGMTYSTHALLMQLEARDQQLQSSINQQRSLQQQLYNHRQASTTNQETVKKMTQQMQILTKKLQLESSQKERLLQQIQQVTRELHSSQLAISNANSNHVLLLADKQRLQQNLTETQTKIHELQATQSQLRVDRNKCLEKITQLQEAVTNLKIHVNQARIEVNSKDEQLGKFNRIIKQLQKDLADKMGMLQSQDSDFQSKNRELYEVRNQLAQIEEDYKHDLDIKSRQYSVELQALRIQLSQQEGLSHQYNSTITRLQSQLLQYQNKISSFEGISSQLNTTLAEKEANIVTLQQRIQAFQQEKYVLMQKIEDIEKQYNDLDERYRRLEDIQRSKVGMEIELSSRQKQQQQLRILLDQAATRQAQIQVDLSHKDQLLKEVLQQKEKQQAIYRQQMAKLTKIIEQLQDQLENERSQQQQKQDEENRLKFQFEDEVRSVRQTIVELEAKHNQQINIQLEHLRKQQNELLILKQEYDKECHEKEQVYIEISALKEYNESLRLAVEEQKKSMIAYEGRVRDNEEKYQQHCETLQNEIAELRFVIEEIKHQKQDLEKELDIARRSKENQLGSFSFNHFEGQQQESPEKLREIIEDLEQKLQARRRQEQQRIRLSYSHTIQASPTAMFGSLQSENEFLLNQKKKIEEEILAYKNHFAGQEAQISQLNGHIQLLHNKLQESQHILQQKENHIRELINQVNNGQRTNEEFHHLEEIIKQKENQIAGLAQRYNQQLENVATLQHEIQIIRVELERAREASEARTVTVQLERTKQELEKSIVEIKRLREQINLAFKQLEISKKEAERQKNQSIEYRKKAQLFENKVSELQERARKASRQMQSEQPHRNLSRLSKRSNISEHQREDNRSKAASSDGELSRRILNDPSKISGQESKFAHNLLVFENSKIHVTRQVVQDIKSQEKEIKEQRQEESVISKQQPENRTPQSSHRQINTTHFERISNENSRKQSQQNINNQNESNRSEERKQANDTPQQRSKINSLTSIRQAEEVQEASAQPAHNSSHSSNVSQPEPEARPKEYLPQQSSKKTISNANESKQNVSIEQQPHRNSFQRQSQFSNVPIYIARQSQIQPVSQQRVEGNQSRSGSKTKVRISYGQPSDKSIEMKRRQPKEMIGSQVSRVSMHSNKIVIENSINQVSPIQNRSNPQPQTPQSFFSKENFQPRQSNQLEHVQQPSDSIINGINHFGSRLSTFGNPRTSVVEAPKNQILRRQSNPIIIQPRIDSAHSPRHSNANPIRPQLQPSPYKPQFFKTSPLPRQQSKKQPLKSPPSKIVMRSVTGGKRNSLLNDTATFGKNSQKGAHWQNQALSDSVDSGIDVLQLDWMAPCCKND